MTFAIASPAASQAFRVWAPGVSYQSLTGEPSHANKGGERISRYPLFTNFRKTKVKNNKPGPIQTQVKSCLSQSEGIPEHCGRGLKNHSDALPKDSPAMPTIVQKRANDIKTDELKTVSLAGAMRQSSSKDEKYFSAPPLSRNIGTTQATSVTPRARNPARICLRGAIRSESSQSGPRKRIEDCLHPTAMPNRMALGTTKRAASEKLRQQR